MSDPLRQGDILFVPVKKLPKGLTDVPRQNGRVVVAEGEITGHCHAIDAPGATFKATDLADVQGRFLKVEAELAKPIDAWKCRNHKGEIVWVPAYIEPKRIEAADLEVIDRAEVLGVPITHDEHLPFVITPGNYEVRRQREYSEAGGISFVAD
jgi:hypothetical protein